MVTHTPFPINEGSHKTLLSNERILRWVDVQPLVGICRSHAHQLVAQGKFPPPVKLGPRASGWLLSEINNWIEQRVVESRGIESAPMEGETI